MMLAIDDGMVSGNATLADVFFLIGAILLVLIAFAAWSPRAIPSGVSFAVQTIGIALIALGLWVL
jgi:hypothetical protein